MENRQSRITTTTITTTLKQVNSKKLLLVVVYCNVGVFKVVGGGVSEAFVPETPHTFITFSFADAVVNEVAVVVAAATIFWLHFQFSCCLCHSHRQSAAVF